MDLRRHSIHGNHNEQIMWGETEIPTHQISTSKYWIKRVKGLAKELILYAYPIPTDNSLVMTKGGREG